MTTFSSSSATRILFALGLLALCFQASYAHTYLSSVVLGGTPLAEGDCVRAHPHVAYDSPIALVSSTNMTCGFLPESAAAANRKCPIAAGSTIGIQWHHQTAAATDDIIDPSHVGPIMVYLAKSDTGLGNVWFKIYEDGYDNGVWAVTKLIANAGVVTVTIPSDIAPGNYLLRGELLALHGAYALNGVQPYVGCVELTITGSGSANPAGVAFPGYYQNTDPGMLFNIYQSPAFTSYPIPGPAVYVSGSSSSSSSSSGSNTGSSNTVAPTSAPTSHPTSVPSTAPTTRPTSGTPTSVPSTPAPVAPTYAPSNGNIKIGLNGGSNTWWIGVIVSGGGETTVKVEMTDSGSVTNWVTLVDNSYAYTYSDSVQLKAPISIRLTSSTGKQVTLPNIFTTFTPSTSLIDTGKAYTSGSSTSAPTQKPTSPTSAPTSKPTSNPTTPPSSGSSTKINIYSGSSTWWFALTVSGNTESIAKVELKDSGSVSSYAAMTNSGYAYTFSTQGTALVTPLTVSITTASGKVATATVSTITPGASLTTSTSL